MRIVKQIKNNLAPAGENIRFEIKRDTGFQWLENKRTKEVRAATQIDIPKNKHELTAGLLKELLSEGEVPALEIKNSMKRYGIGEKTLQEVKTDLGIKSIRRMKKWYWKMPGANDEEGKK